MNPAPYASHQPAHRADGRRLCAERALGSAHIRRSRRYAVIPGPPVVAAPGHVALSVSAATTICSLSQPPGPRYLRCRSFGYRLARPRSGGTGHCGGSLTRPSRHHAKGSKRRSRRSRVSAPRRKAPALSRIQIGARASCIPLEHRQVPGLRLLVTPDYGSASAAAVRPTAVRWVAALRSGPTRSPEEVLQMSSVVARLDHVYVPFDDARAAFDVFSGELGLPVMWPFDSYGVVTSGTVVLGNLHLETLQSLPPSAHPLAPPSMTAVVPARVSGLAFEPALDVDAVLAELDRRGALTRHRTPDHDRRSHCSPTSCSPSSAAIDCSCGSTTPIPPPPNSTSTPAASPTCGANRAEPHSRRRVVAGWAYEGSTSWSSVCSTSNTRLACGSDCLIRCSRRPPTAGAPQAGPPSDSLRPPNAASNVLSSRSTTWPPHDQPGQRPTGRRSAA